MEESNGRAEPRGEVELALRPVQDVAALRAALQLRHVVFVQEQRVPEDLEVDEHDALGASDVVQVLATLEAVPLATGRLRCLDATTGKLERVAVLAAFRGRGVGRALVRHLEELARGRGLGQLRLSAQISACGFWDRLGYRTRGEPFLEAGIEHVTMHKALG
jgi:predicted GNAT family N-acyltransferase